MCITVAATMHAVEPGADMCGSESAKQPFAIRTPLRLVALREALLAADTPRWVCKSVGRHRAHLENGMPRLRDGHCYAMLF